MNTNGKMNWLAKQFFENSVKHVIRDTNKNFGAISCPTGYGKSGIIFTDIIDKIVETQHNNKKIIINLSTPIIKLCAQQGIDLLNLIELIKDCVNIDKSKIVIVNNNSGNCSTIYSNDEENNIIEDLGYDCISICDIKKYFINNNNYNVCLVISCNKSLCHFINKISKFNVSNIDIVNYLDEAHTLSITEPEMYSETTKVDIKNLCRFSTSVYLISATNKQNIVETVNFYECCDSENVDADFIYKVTPLEAINENKICHPLIDYMFTPDGKITPKICCDFMRRVKQENDKIVHKILITCNDTNELRKLSKDLEKHGKIVFSTCCNDGMINISEYTSNTRKEYTSITQFISDIDNCQNDCFVLHIRQLISGIDIATLTDAIIQRSDTSDYNKYDTDIQTIGRTLRLGKERGIEYEKRNKKYSNILYITKEDNVNIEDHLSEFFIRYYNMDVLRFRSKINNPINDKTNTEIKLLPGVNYYYNNDEIQNPYWDNLKLNIKKFIYERIIPVREKYLERGISYNNENEKIVENTINEIKKRFDVFADGKVYTVNYIKNEALRNTISELFKELKICN